MDATNCVHCKPCVIQDPNEIITWVPPEGRRVEMRRLFGTAADYSALSLPPGVATKITYSCEMFLKDCLSSQIGQA
jgi:electron transfer flavoprotein-ubiquinone oxidoreductase-like iron-sulfur protein